MGGLTVLHECLVSLPEEDFLYLGDDAHFPYGTKELAAVRARVEAAGEFLLARGAKLLVLACNSATTAGLDAAREAAARASVEVVAVIEPEAEIAAAITDSGRIGVLATPATVEGGAYHRALQIQGRELEVIEVEAPDLAPIIQRGNRIDDEVVSIVRSYCAPLQRAEVDTVILGCTHYPLVRPMLQRFLGRGVEIVSSGAPVARQVEHVLGSRGLGSPQTGEGRYSFLCTGDTEAFRTLGTGFLQMPLGAVEHVTVGGGAPAGHPLAGARR